MPKAIATNVKIDERDLIKLKSFCTAKETSIRVNSNLENKRKILQSTHLTKVYKEVKQIDKKKKKTTTSKSR